MKPIQIIATIGPASKETIQMKSMIDSGLSLARLNFSWGTHQEHRQFIENIREASQSAGVTIPIIQDLSGPRIQKGVSHTFNSEVTVITEKDISDVKAVTDLQVEYVALSFVKNAEDITNLRTLLAESGSQSKVIAKIERQKALNNIDEIIEAADGIMIARGDLGDAIPIETLPFVKKDILKRCNEANKPAIVATDMLSSMTNSTNPSRADISDIAHAVLDGASATMLSNETAVGSNPNETIAVMRKVVNEAQKHSQITPISF